MSNPEPAATPQAPADRPTGGLERLSAEQLQVYRALEARPHTSRNHLAAVLDIDRERTGALLSDLRTWGFASAEGRGRSARYFAVAPTGGAS